MNKKLKFAWAIVIAFIAIIIISYLSFVGFTYLTNGNFTYALIGMGVTDVFYIVFFLGAQQMKASDVKIHRKIIWERIFIFGSPLIFILGMISISHFWTVNSQNSQIVETFTSSISNARQLFADYEIYSDERIKTYAISLNKIIANKTDDPQTYRRAGFEDFKENIQKKNMVETLRLQLLSQNYDSLKTVALEWIDNANLGASTLNVFLLGNTKEIKVALLNWENQLQQFSDNKLSNESFLTQVTDFSSTGVQDAINGIDSLTAAFTTQKFPTFGAIVFGIIMYLLLLLPYIAQERHSKSIYRLVGDETRAAKSKTKKAGSNDETLDLQEDNEYRSF